MMSVTVVRAKSELSDLLRRAEHGGERVLVHRHGKPVAAIVSTSDLRRLEALEDAADVADAQTALVEAEQAGTTPLHVVLDRHGLGHLLKPAEPGPRRPTRRAIPRG